MQRRDYCYAAGKPPQSGAEFKGINREGSLDWKFLP